MWYPIIVTVILGYLLGNLNGSVSISNLVAHEDVRIHGSGNAGMTNFYRSYGGWSTLLVMLVDVMKTAIACMAGGLMLESYGMAPEGKMIGALAVTLGHNFPALLGFRGGKGIICGITAAIVIDWRASLIIFVVFAIAYAVTKYVSLGSVLGAVTYIVTFVIFWHEHPFVMIGGIVLGLLAIYMHRSNISRLIKGTESKVYLGKKGKKE